MTRLFVPSTIQVRVVTVPGAGPVISDITLNGGLYLFGADNDRLDARIALDQDEQAAIMAVVDAASTRHWAAMATAYEATFGDHEVDVPPLAGGG